MSNTYDTSMYPLGSTHPKVLFNNASNSDDAMNAFVQTWIDRFGANRKTWWGFEQDFNNFLISSGFEPAHLVYVDGTPLQVDRVTQLIDRAGSVYRVKMPATFPVMLTGTWATDQNLLVDVGDAALRQDLADVPDGSGMIGYRHPATGSVTRTVRTKLDDIYTMEDAGAIGDNVADDTVALQRWVENIGRLGGGTARLTAGKTYYVPGTIIIPQFVGLDLNGCTLRGNRPGGGTASMFQSGYFNGSDVLVTNVGAAEDLVTLDGIRVFNGRILEAYRGMEFTNANRNCAIQEITFTGCLQSWLLTRCWSISLGPCFSDTNSDIGVPTYKFVEAINTVVLNQVRAVTDFAFEFSSGSTGSASIVLNNCDVEGSNGRAFYFQGQFHGVTWVGGYFEGIPGVVYDFADVTTGTFNWRGTFNFSVGTLLREPTSSTSELFGEWDTSNAIEGAGLPGYPATLNIQHPRNTIKFRLRTKLFEAGPSLPAFVNVGDNLGADVQMINNRVGVSNSDIRSRTISSKGVLPLHYSGNMGRTFPNQVPDCTHSAFNSTVTAVLVDTQIVLSDTVFAKYLFVVTDSVGSYTLYGDIYGSNASPRDATGKTVTVGAGVGTNMRITLNGFTHPSGTYSCTGTVQLCT